jgi:PKD repeat protein
MKKNVFAYIVSMLCVYSHVFAETEPNNTFQDATTITLNGSLGGQLSINDVDWYKVTIPDDGKLVFNYSSSSTSCNNLRLYTSSESLITTGSYGMQASVSYPNLAAGTYYLYIAYYSGGTGDYTIENVFTPAAYSTDVEPNDDVENAQPIAVQDSITGRLYYRSGNTFDIVDWYSIALPDNGRITINVQGESTLSVNNLQIYDVDKTSLIATGSYGQNASVTSNNLLAGTYYVKVRRYTGYGSYNLKTYFYEANLTNDLEPNDYISQAQSFGLNDTITGQLYYMQNGVYDLVDWFSVTIPDDGKLTFFAECESTLTVNNLQIYDKDTITLITTGSYGNTASVSYPNLTAGIYYIKVRRYTGYGSYKLSNTFTPATYESDSYTNDVIKQAQPIKLNDSITGRLYYRDILKFDTEDWFSVTIPDDGKLTFNVACESSLTVNNLQIYDKDTLRLVTTGSYGNKAAVTYPNLTSGTYFVKVARYTGYGSYVLYNSFTPATLAADSIANDSIHQAQHIALNDSITGRLYYRNISNFDTQDWYMLVLPRHGNVHFQVYTTDGLSVNNLKLFAQNKTTLLATGSYGSTASVQITKYQSDTLYLLVQRYTGYGSYVLKNSYIPVPIAKFSVFQNLHSIATVNHSKNASSYTWHFGDGQSSTEAYAKHTYDLPGTYKLELIATNVAGTDTTHALVEILGIRDFAPYKGGNTGDVTVHVYGGGFKANSNCWLEKDGEKIHADTTMFVEPGVLKAGFDLRDKELGVYDLKVKLPDGTILTQEASFTIEEGRKAEPWANITGRDRVLFNRWQTYTVNYGNSGNVDATGVPLWILLPRGEGIEIDFSGLEMSLPLTDDPVWKLMLDSIPIFMDISTYNGEPFEGRLYPLFIPNIPAGGSYSLKFKIKIPHDVEMYAWVSPPYFQSPVNPDVADCIRWAQLKAVANGLINVINTQLPGVSCVNNVLQSIYALKYGDPKPVSSHLWQISRATFTCAADFFGPLKAYQISVAVIEMGLDIYDNYDADNECKKPKPDPDDSKEPKDPPFNDEPKSQRKIRTVASFDPNEVVGPKGYTEKNMVARNIVYNYDIYFENKSDATAPATEVIVIDTLDTSVFNLSTFNLRFVNFGTTTINIPQGGYEFTTDVDLRPQLPVILRINAKLDTLSGIATWHYITLDTLTFDVNEDPDAGFLPPNIIAPMGEGIVGFSVELKESVTEVTEITNKATIFFDANPPIVTNTYSNFIDETSPQSSMNYANEEFPVVPLYWEAIDYGSGVYGYSIFVSKNNGPYESLLGNTKLTSVNFIADPGNNYKFKCVAIDSIGNRESFQKSYDISLDVPLNAARPVVDDELFFVSPNPASDAANVKFSTSKKATVTLQVSSMTGNIVYSHTFKKIPAGHHEHVISVKDYSNGIYNVSLISGNQIRSKRLLKFDF